MFSRKNQQEILLQQQEPQQPGKRRKRLIPSGSNKALSLRARLFWAVILASPLLICAIIFLIVMFSIYQTQIVTRLPIDELTPYQGELLGVGGVILASIGIGLLGIFKVKFVKTFYAIGVVLFIILMVVFEVFISSSTGIYTLPPHLEITRTGFSPAQMSIFTGDQVHISNTSDNIIQTLFISSSTNSEEIPGKLRRPGLTLQPGQSVDILFNGAGTFTLSNSTTPGLTLVITVTDNSSGPDNFPDTSGD